MGLFLFFISVAATLSLTSGAPPTECCLSKSVGGVEYVLAYEGNTSPYHCLKDCVYEAVDHPGSRFCFAPGHLPVVCEDVTPTGPPTGTTEGPGGGCECGKTRGSRIVGGEDAEVNQYPWMIALSDAPAANPLSDQFCGASLVASRFAITAAHCLVDIEAVDIVAVLGEHDLSSDTESVIPRKVVNVELIIRHEGFIDAQKGEDIAVLKLAEEVDLTIYTPVCLPNQGADFAGQNAWVYGWGVLSYGSGNFPDILQELQVEIKSKSECETTMEYLGFTGIADGGMVCAGGIEEEDSCSGDSGGPLTVEVDGQHQLVGAVSVGAQCALEGLFGIYAEVPFYRSWVDQQMDDNGGATFCEA